MDALEKVGNINKYCPTLIYSAYKLHDISTLVSVMVAF